MPSADRVRLAQRHEKLRELMVQKVLKLAGRQLADSEKEFVVQEVDMLIHRGENSENSLKHIADHVRSLTPAGSVVSAPTEDALKRHDAQHSKNPRKPAGGSQVPTSVVSAARAADAEVARQTKAQKGKFNKQNLPAGLTPELMAAVAAAEAEQSASRRIRHPDEVHADDLWAVMAAKDVEEFHKDILQERRIVKQKEEEQRLYLEQQVALRDRKASAIKVDEYKYVVEEERQKKLWEEEERRKEAEKKKRFAEEKASRDEQLEAARKRRAIEEAKRRAEDAIAALRDKEAYIAEQELIKVKRIQAKEEVVKAQAFNREFEEVRAKVKAKEKAADLEHQKMFLAQLKKQDEERELALVKMQEKQRHQQQIAFQMQSTIAEKAADDERKALEVKKRKDDEAEAAERARAEKAAAAKVRQRQYLMLQMIEREELRKKEIDSVEVTRAAILAEQEAAERKEAEKVLRQKKAALEHRKAIEEQIQRSEARNRPIFMSEKEKQLNIPLLKKAGLQVESR